MVQMNRFIDWSTFLVLLLSVQVALQPILTRYYYGIAGGTGKCNKLGLILGQEVIKSLICLGVLVYKGMWRQEWRNWSFRRSLEIGAVLSMLYVLQHYLMQLAYQSLSPTKFNIINQTKTFWTAVLLYFKMQKRQSVPQILSLCALVLASVLLVSQNEEPGDNNEASLFGGLSSLLSSSALQFGVLPCALASFLSAYSGIVAQIQLQRHNRDTYLFSLELGAYMCFVVALLYLLQSTVGSLFASSSNAAVFAIDSNPWCGGYVVVPMITNSIGAILVGLLLKYSSGEAKGFALALGIAMTGVFESLLLTEARVSHVTWLTLPVVATAMLVHSWYPVAQPAPPQVKAAEKKLETKKDA
jgi:drug/metabolite transporter (DMT)-like permease